MHHTDHEHAPTRPPDHPAADGPAINATSPYTAPCRRCGRRLHLSEDEMVTAMTERPVCWECASSAAADRASGGPDDLSPRRRPSAG